MYLVLFIIPQKTVYFHTFSAKNRGFLPQNRSQKLAISGRNWVKTGRFESGLLDLEDFYDISFHFVVNWEFSSGALENASKFLAVCEICNAWGRWDQRIWKDIPE